MDQPIEWEREFDVVIVGGGAAGCVLASRLSEDRRRHVLLVEAGPDVAAPGSEHPDVLDPFAVNAYSNRELLWPGSFAEYRPGGGLPPRRGAYRQGRGVGGGSNVNGMGADRGQPSQYDGWRDNGAPGWGWDDVLPYFRKLERELDFTEAVESHGFDGPMPVRRLPRHQWGPFAAAVAGAMEARGLPYLPDYLAEFGDGFGAVPTNGLPARRVSAAMAYLTAEVRSRRNLVIRAGARAQRVTFEGRRATGVTILDHGAVKSVRCRQVVLSGGAIQSPTMLMRSGIGPASRLTGLGVDVVADLPGVGCNLQNHQILTLTTYLPAKARQQADNVSFLQNWLRYSSGYPGCANGDMSMLGFNRVDWHALGRRVGALGVTVLN